MEEEIPESEENKIPKFLYMTYGILVLLGLWIFISYWNGSHGWLDRGHWRELQEAAKTKVMKED